MRSYGHTISVPARDFTYLVFPACMVALSGHIIYSVYMETERFMSSQILEYFAVYSADTTVDELSKLQLLFSILSLLKCDESPPEKVLIIVYTNSATKRTHLP